MSDFGKLLAAMASENRRDTPRPVHEAQIMELRAMLERYAAPNRFNVGDIVTPRKGANIVGAGEPHIVLEVLEQPHRSWDWESGSSQFGRLLTMRVGCLANDDESYVAYAVEHHAFEPYVEVSA